MKKLFIYSYLVFGTSFTPIAARYVVQQISPLSLAFIRFGIAAVFFLIIFIYRGSNIKIDKKDIPRFLICAALVIPINQVCFLKGISLSTASHSGVIYSLTPLFALFLSIKLKTEKFSLPQFFAITTTIIGICIIFYESLSNSLSTESTLIYGDILLFFAVFSWAGYLTLSKPLVEKYGSVKVSVIAFWIGLVMYIPIFIYDLPNLSFNNVNLIGWLGFFQLSVLVAFGSYFVFVYSTKYVDVSRLTTTLNMSPVVTIIFSWLLLGENISDFFIAGSAVTISGILFYEIFIRRKKIFGNSNTNFIK